MSQSIFPGGSIYGPAVAAMLRGDTVYQSYGVQFEFASGPLAVWQGFGQLDAREFVDVAGHVSPLFDGIGNFGKVGSIEIGAGAQTQGVVLELSGIDARIALLAQNQGAEIKGRLARVYFLFFDAAGKLMFSHIRRTYVMDSMTRKISAGGDPPTASISLTCEPVLAAKNRMPFSMLSDADQRTRHPGDKIFERQGYAAGKLTLVW